MQIRLTLSNRTRQTLLHRLYQAYAGGNIRLIRRVHCLLYLADGKTVAEVARVLNLGEDCGAEEHVIGSFLPRLGAGLPEL